jgi:hypothetical protein
MSTTDLYVEDLRQKIVFLKAKDGGDVLADNVMNKILKGDVMRLVHHLIDGGRYGSRTADVGNVHGGSNGNNGAAGSSPPTSSSSQSEDERLNVLLFLRNENKVFKNVNDSIVSTASNGQRRRADGRYVPSSWTGSSATAPSTTAARTTTSTAGWNAANLTFPSRELALVNLLAATDADVAAITEVEYLSTSAPFATNGYNSFYPLTKTG